MTRVNPCVIWRIPINSRLFFEPMGILLTTNLKGELACGLLAPALRPRFFELFGVASRKSVFAWQESELPEAQVAVLDGTSDLMRLQPVPPCVIWVGREQAAPGPRSAWVGRLAADYTLSDLIDILDRAAVFLLDWKARQPAAAALANPSVSSEVHEALARSARAFAHSSIEPVVPAVAAKAAMATAQGSRYRLASWVFLGAPFDGPGCISALALLARQPVTASQLQTHSGLSAVDVRALLQELARRNVLQATAAPTSAQPTVSSRTPPQASHGFVRRLSHWLKGTGGRS